MNAINTENVNAPQSGPAEGADRQDTAAQSLARALRWCFRLLIIIMILVGVAFLLSGVKTIQPNQVGIKKRFGKFIGISHQGLAYTWPYPVGEIEIVNVSEQDVPVDDFWMHETARDKTLKLSERRPAAEGLRPGWDGALLTGDRQLIHAKFTCTYKIKNALLYAKYVMSAAPGAAGPEDKDRHLQELVRSAASNAAVAAAAKRTAESIVIANREAFATDIMNKAQKQLDSLMNVGSGELSGVIITNADIDSITWPLRALSAYRASQQASQSAQQRREEARAEAISILNSTAGQEVSRKLVGEPWNQSSAKPAKEEDYDLIGQYARARRNGQTERAEELLEKIDNLLVNDAGGEVRSVISEAQAYRNSTVEVVKGRAKKFNDLLGEYRKNPEFMLQRLWAEAREEILTSPTAEKFYLSDGPKTILRISRDPEVLRRILREQIRSGEEKDSGN